VPKPVLTRRRGCSTVSPCPSQTQIKAQVRCGQDVVRNYKTTFGRCRCAVCLGAGQDRELPDPGIADIGARRSPGHAGVAAVSSRELDGRPSSVGSSGCPGRVVNGTNEAGVGSSGDRSRHRGWCALWLRLGGCRLRAERAVPPGLTARRLAWALGIPRHLKVYPVDVQMIWPIAKRGRPRQRHVPDILSIPAEDMLASAKWRRISWRSGTKGKLKARFAAVRVRVADGPPQRNKGQQHLPGDEAWLIGEHRMSGEKKYYLANLSAKTDLLALAATVKARWICEQAHQQLKEELGLDHFEGRSWQGLHRHALMTMIAYAFLQHRRLKTARREKKNQRAATSTDIARRAPSHRRIGRSATTAAMPALQKRDLKRKAV
jgi:DDE superfamily endonuclease